jgi:hypothetical protein
MTIPETENCADTVMEKPKNSKIQEMVCLNVVGKLLILECEITQILDSFCLSM